MSMHPLPFLLVISACLCLLLYLSPHLSLTLPSSPFLTCFFLIAAVSILLRSSFPVSLSLLDALIAGGMGEVSGWFCWDKAFLRWPHHRCHHSPPPPPSLEPVTYTTVFPVFYPCLLPSQVWRYQRKGHSHPLPMTGPAFSAHLPWALIGLWGKSCFLALRAQDLAHSHHLASLKGHGFASLAPRAYFLSSALLASVRKQGIGLKVQGYLPSAKAPEMGLCTHCSHLPPLSGPGVVVQV